MGVLGRHSLSVWMCIDAHVHHYCPKLVHASVSLQACTDSLSFMVGLTKLVSQAVPSSCIQPCS